MNFKRDTNIWFIATLLKKKTTTKKTKKAPTKPNWHRETLVVVVMVIAHILRGDISEGEDFIFYYSRQTALLHSSPGS